MDEKSARWYVLVKSRRRLFFAEDLEIAQKPSHTQAPPLNKTTITTPKPKRGELYNDL